MQEAVDDLTQHLNEVEKEMAEWHPVSDILLENLQLQVDHTQVCLAPLTSLFQFAAPPGGCVWKIQSFASSKHIFTIKLFKNTWKGPIDNELKTNELNRDVLVLLDED